MDYVDNPDDNQEYEYDQDDEEYTQVDQPNQLFGGREEDLGSDIDAGDYSTDDDKERLDLLDAETEYDPTVARDEIEMKDAYADLSRAAFQGNVFQVDLKTDIADVYHKISRYRDPESAQEQPIVIMELLYRVYVEVLGNVKGLSPFPPWIFTLTIQPR